MTMNDPITKPTRRREVTPELDAAMLLQDADGRWSMWVLPGDPDWDEVEGSVIV